MAVKKIFTAPTPPMGVRVTDKKISDSGWGQKFGAAAKIIGPDLPTADARIAKNEPHLRNTLGYLDQVWSYLHDKQIRMFRLSGDSVRYATHPDYPHLQWNQQRLEAAEELLLIGDRARALGLRLSFHPGQYTLLSSKDDGITSRSIEDLLWQCQFLDALGMGPECRVLIHAGGVYGERELTQARIIERVMNLEPEIKNRLAFENDDVSWPTEDVLEICQATDTPMIFDWHHHDLRSQENWMELFPQVVATWPQGVRPKTHFSSSRDPAATSRMKLRAHSDYVDAQRVREIITWLDSQKIVVDIMLEAKVKNLAVLQLRKDLGYDNSN
jgi:UV DNA damage endonuclease